MSVFRVRIDVTDAPEAFRIPVWDRVVKAIIDRSASHLRYSWNGSGASVTSIRTRKTLIFLTNILSCRFDHSRLVPLSLEGRVVLPLDQTASADQILLRHSEMQ